MNDLNKVKSLPVKTNMYEYGLSTLHAWIRMHITYRIQNTDKKWQIRDLDKIVVQRNKLDIQEKLRKNVSLLVDIPHPGRFFQQPKLASDLTGVSEELITRFGVILRTMACEYKVNTEAFETYCWQTAKIFVDKYPWFYMPFSIHKILIHGSDIIKNASLPIGMMSEEAQESRNKDL